MKNGKFLFFLLILMICSGCSAEYNLNIDKDDKIKEIITLSAEDGNDIEQIEKYQTYLPIDKDADDASVFEKKIDGVSYYEQKKSTSYDKLKFSYLHHFDTFQQDYITNSSYEYVTLTKDKENLILSTSRINKAFEIYNNLTSVTINITSRYKLVDTNADTHSNYKYTWVIDRTNYNNKYLYLSLDTSNRKKIVSEEVNDTGIFAYLPLILIIVGVIVVGWLVVKKGDKRNQV